MRPVLRPLVAAVAGVALLAAGCGDDLRASEAAVVDGHTITRAEVEEPVRAALDRAGALEGLDAEERAEIVEPLQRQVLALLIQAAVIRDMAAERGISVPEGAVEEVYAEQVEASGGEEELADRLAQQRLSVSLFRDVLLPTQELVEMLRAEIESDLEPTEAREARHILVETEEDAQDVLQELARGADFATLAEERSTDPGSAARGGDLGAAPRGAYVEPFDDAVWAATPGEVIGPVQTQFGYHIIEVTGESSVDPADLPAEERQQRVNQRLNEVLEAGFAAAEVRVSSRFGVWDSVSGTVERAPEVGRGE